MFVDLVRSVSVNLYTSFTNGVGSIICTQQYNVFVVVIEIALYSKAFMSERQGGICCIDSLAGKTKVLPVLCISIGIGICIVGHNSDAFEDAWQKGEVGLCVELQTINSGNIAI